MYFSHEELKNHWHKKLGKRILYTLFYLIATVLIVGLILAYLPNPSRINNGITPEEASTLRQHFTGPHHVFTTADGQTLFLWRWNPDSIAASKKDIAVLIFPGFTAYGGAYGMAGKPISACGYTVFGLVLGAWLSGGNRGDNPDKDRSIGDLAESVKFIKGLGFTRVIVLGHSLGVAAAMVAADSIPHEISGLVLLSGAYEGRKVCPNRLAFFKNQNIWRVLFSGLPIRPWNIIGTE